METLGFETSTPRPNSSDASRRRRRWTLCGFVCVTVFALAAVAAGRPETHPDPNVLPDQSVLQEAVDDPVYDSFLQEFGALRANAARRRYLTAEVVSAAARQQIDPDLLFALVAAESSFNHAAVSTKGARGLGQLMFPTARAVAPSVVRRPDDLYSVRRNLYVTARHLRQLLVECSGDLRKALTRYNAGTQCGRPPQRDDNRYVAAISTYFAALKVKRGYHELVAVGDGTIATTGR
jgi:soluble lytic murein transglycosylase-like protein